MSKNRSKQGKTKSFKPKGMMAQGTTKRPRDTARRKQAGLQKGLPLKSSNGFFLFGRNSVEAALQNANRECIALYLTEKASREPQLTKYGGRAETHIVEDTGLLTASVPDGAPHQGVVMEVRPLAGHHLNDFEPLEGQKNIILMLDQVTDPHNVGACMRTAAAFGARALITQDRNSPMESGTLARSAAGGLEILPWVRVANLSDALSKLRDLGYWHVGLDGSTALSIRDVSLGDNIVIVMGSEGSGLRPLVKKNCDSIAKIPMIGDIESLNVSNAAAIAMYELGDIKP